MVDRQWFAEGVQVYETGEEEYFVEGVQICNNIISETETTNITNPLSSFIISSKIFNSIFIK